MVSQSTDTTVPLGIFWDIENCAIPLTKSASGVANGIRDFIQDRHPECGYAKEFFCCGDSKKFADTVTDGLNRNGVIVAHVNSSAKNAADDKLSELIDSFVDNFGHNRPVLVVITGDINFAKTIRNAIRKNIAVVLIHGHNVAPDLKNLVKESYLFHDVIQDVRKANPSDELKTTHLKVTDLPIDKPIKDIITRLSQMTSNCGGKPLNFFDGNALLEFGCKDDALRALQRISGDNCFGHQFEVKLIEDLKTSTEVEEFNICKSIISGLSVKSGDNVTEVVHQMVAKWEDFNINSKLIVKVEEVADNELIVTAVTPEANQKLLTSAQTHMKFKWNSDTKWTDMKGYESMPGLGWILKIPEVIADDRRSVIKGFKSKKDDSVLEMIRNLVNSWRDRKVNGSLVVFVERNTKQTQIDGKVNLFVTATTAEASKTLVRAAKHYLKANSGIKWRRYMHRSHNTYDDIDGYECKSVIKGLNTRSSQNITEFVRKIVNDWDDRAVTGSSIVCVETNTRQRGVDGKVNLFVTAVNAKASQALVLGAKRHIKPEHKIKWTKYTPRDPSRRTESVSSDDFDDNSNVFSGSSTSSSLQLNVLSNETKSRALLPAPTPSPTPKSFPANRVNDNSMPTSLSIITGLRISGESTAVKTVRKLVTSWRDNKINGNFIVRVEPQWGSPQLNKSIVPLIVTATNPDTNRALVTGAHMYLKPKDGISWIEYRPQHTNRNSNERTFYPQRQALNANYLLNMPNMPMNSMQNIPPFPYCWSTVPIWLIIPLQAPIARIPAPLYNETRRVTPQTSPTTSTSPPNQSNIKPQNLVTTLTDQQMVSNSRRSVIRGVFTKADADVLKTVRREVMSWRDSRTNGNFIKKVERDSRFAGTDGMAPLYVMATCAKTCRALISAAEQHLNAGEGIVWSHLNARHESSPQTVESSLAVEPQPKACHPNSMFVICGLSTKHTDDCLLMVRKLITCFESSRVCADDIMEVTRDYKFESRDGPALLFVTVSDADKKQVILDMTKSVDLDIQFKDTMNSNTNNKKKF